jgi:hypothetical protein
MFKQFLTDNYVARRYMLAGTRVGNMISYWFMGVPDEYDAAVRRAKKWEKEYSRRGYRTIGRDDFMDAGGYDQSIAHLMMVKRAAGEKAVLYF